MAIIDSSALRAHLGLEDSDDDSTMGTAVAAACSAVAIHCGRQFDADTTATAKLYRPEHQGKLATDDFWTTTGLVVKTDDDDDGTFETTWTLDTDFILEPTNGERYGESLPYHEIVGLDARSFPTWNRRPSVQVTAKWGWASVPSPVTQAALLIAARVWQRRKSPEGVLGGFQDFSAVRVSSRQDPDAMMLLAPYRHPGVVALVG